MGAYSFSIPKELLIHAKDLLHCTVFVETGTFHGRSSIVASGIFEQVFTCEYSPAIRAIALRNFAGTPNIESREGDSPLFLADLKAQLADRAVCYWLDAHWCASPIDVGSPGQTRLLEELAAIGSLNEQSVIFIDDARYYLAPPKAPNQWEDWPDISAVINGLQAISSKHFIMIYNDVIAFIPKSIQRGFVELAHQTLIDPSESLNTIKVLSRKLFKKYGASPSAIIHRIFRHG